MSYKLKNDENKKIKKGQKESCPLLLTNPQINQWEWKNKNSADLGSNKRKLGKKDQKCTIKNIKQCKMNITLWGWVVFIYTT